MGVFTQIDPTTVRCMPGKCLVQIVEVLAKKTRGGLHVPEAYAAPMNKDTFYGKLVKVGPPPQLEHYKSGHGPGWDVRMNKSGQTWPEEVMDQFKVNDIVIFPRDVEIVFIWEGQRYCICYLHEAICSIAAEEFDENAFEVLPYKTDVPVNA